MLKMKNNHLTLSGTSEIDGVPIKEFNAKIDFENPDNVQIQAPYISNQDLYRENRAQVRQDETAFEDFVYAMQDKVKAVCTAMNAVNMEQAQTANLSTQNKESK